MIVAFILLVAVTPVIIDPAHVREATKQIAAYCAVLKCPRPVVVAVVPPETIERHGAITRRIGGGSGCAINLTAEAVHHPDWLAHEVCHCAHDYDAIDEHGWRESVSAVERTRREDEAMRCAQKLLEKR